MKRVQVQQIYDASDITNTDIAIASTATVYTPAFKLSGRDNFCLSYQAADSGTPDLLIQLQQGYTLPGTEGSTDDDWVIPEGIANIETNLVTKTRHHKQITPVTLPYARLKITGNAANPATTTIDIKVSMEEEF